MGQLFGSEDLCLPKPQPVNLHLNGRQRPKNAEIADVITTEVGKMNCCFGSANTVM